MNQRKPSRASRVRTHQDKNRGSGPKSFGPKPIGNVLSELITRKGYANIQSGEQHVEAWHAVAGPFGEQTRAVGIRRGVLEVNVKSSSLLQEITFQKTSLLKSIVESNPELRITDIRFRVGSIS